ncbi:NADPH oxidase activator 1-like isoform X1 [Melanerpes formicivorus]|uniref:NADPH oxidase activator 1-like isoform X1 n=1 Tax=Melanerpes formicivorus TaxID=211600 RepID=UPI00358F3FB7
MAYRELVRRWHEGVLAADAERWDAALDTFAGIPEPPSRIRFNIGCVELLAGRPRQALRKDLSCYNMEKLLKFCITETSLQGLYFP